VSELVLAARALLAGLLAVSASAKLRGPEALHGFAASTVALRIASRRWSFPLAVATAVAEAVTAVLLAVPGTAPAGLAAAAVLLATFTAAIGLSLKRGARAPCRCFGASRTPLGAPQLLRNLVLLAVCGAALAASTRPAGPLHPAGVAVALGAAAVAIALVLLLDQAVELLRDPAPSIAGPGSPRR
jgi:Methylamine utilisation protein MauE